MVLGILVLLISLVLRRVKLTILQDCRVKPMSTPNLNFSFNSKSYHKNPRDVLSQDILSIKSVPISKDTDFFLICSGDIEKQNQVLYLVTQKHKICKMIIESIKCKSQNLNARFFIKKIYIVNLHKTEIFCYFIVLCFAVSNASLHRLLILVLEKLSFFAEPMPSITHCNKLPAP